MAEQEAGMGQDRSGGDVAPHGSETFEAISADLRGLRTEAGLPSFSQIARSIGDARQARGVRPEAARPARSTVYDLFRDGRRRMDAELVGEVVVALGGSEEEARAWRSRCHAAAAGLAHQRRSPVTLPVEVVETGVGAGVDSSALSLARAGVEATTEPASMPVKPTPVEPTPVEPTPSVQPTGTGRVWSPQLLLGAVLAGITLNLIGRWLVVGLELPLHLDMVGTALVAVAVGPWTAVIVAILSSVLGVGVSGVASVFFVPVAVVGALLWGYGVHHLDLGRTLPRFFGLTAATALACTLVAWPILVLGGWGGHAGEGTVERMLGMIDHPMVAMLLTSLLLSLADKFIAAFCALAVVEAMADRPGRTQLHPA
ncbi:hypothetical protein ACQBAT_06605 [Ornithinimicrobium sp. Y1847]|uniref:hypothetical protein n=1 Tax=Ornithinimicrobium sp. Y1847 TaxID=3405419 RepID=UPI003B66F528